MNIELTCDPALDFVRSMIPHHRGAVAMCEVLLTAQSYTDADLVHFCDHVRMEQNTEVASMLQWLEEKGEDEGKLCSNTMDNHMMMGDMEHSMSMTTGMSGSGGGSTPPMRRTKGGKNRKKNKKG